jgi:hypothetical protein
MGQEGQLADTNAGLLRRLNTDMDACGYSHQEMLGACGREDDTRCGDEAAAHATASPVVAARAHAPQSDGGRMMWYVAAAAAAAVAIIALPSFMRHKRAAARALASEFGGFRQ